MRDVAGYGWPGVERLAGRQLECSVWDRSVGLIRAKPPRRAGRASKSRSESLGEGLPVRAGMKWNLRVSSRGWKRWPVDGMVRVRKVHLLTKPCVKAACAAWG